MKVKHKRVAMPTGEVLEILEETPTKYRINWGNNLISTETADALIFLEQKDASI
jgi:hypothetical protein